MTPLQRFRAWRAERRSWRRRELARRHTVIQSRAIVRVLLDDGTVRDHHVRALPQLIGRCEIDWLPAKYAAIDVIKTFGREGGFFDADEFIPASRFRSLTVVDWTEAE